MTANIHEEKIKKAVEFHGHTCPGLWIGLRASELCLGKLGMHSDENPVVCVTETDMCAVDAIQVLTGCTFGKGNLIHRDFGKNAFSFFHRRSGDALRAAVRPHFLEKERAEMKKIGAESSGGPGPKRQKERIQKIREEMRVQLMGASLGNIFEVKPPHFQAPNPARILNSMACEDCCETVMESRVRHFDGRILCIPCFTRVEQK